MAAGATYEPIATTTLSSAASSITFSSISSAYTDLRLVFTYQGNGSNTSPKLTLNNDTATNYSGTYINGDGASAISGNYTSTSFIYTSATSANSTVPNFDSIDIFSYTGSTYKTVLITSSADQNGSGSVRRIVGLWRSTSAINRIDLTGTTNFAIGTTATLYGIKAA